MNFYGFFRSGLVSWSSCLILSGHFLRVIGDIFSNNWVLFVREIIWFLRYHIDFTRQQGEQTWCSAIYKYSCRFYQKDENVTQQETFKANFRYKVNFSYKLHLNFEFAVTFNLIFPLKSRNRDQRQAELFSNEYEQSFITISQFK